MRSTIIVGNPPNPPPRQLSDAQRAEHVYVLGKSGTGKTMLLCSLVLQDLRRGACVVFLDAIGTGVPYLEQQLAADNLKALAEQMDAPRGLCQLLERERTRALERIRIVDLAQGEFTDRFNPLEPLALLSVEEQAQAFASGMQRLVEGPMAQMRQLLLNLVALASILLQTPGATVADMVELMCMDTDSMQDYLRRIRKRQRSGRIDLPLRRDLMEHYMHQFFAQTRGRDRRDLVASTLRAVLMLLGDPIAKRLLSSPQGNLNLEQVTQAGHSLLVSVPPHNLHSQKAIFGFIQERLVTLAMRRSSQDVKAGDVPQIHLVIDEFQQVFTQETAQEAAVLRNKGVSLVLAHQSGSQPPFNTPEGRAMLESVRDNCSTNVLLRMGRQDAMDLAPTCFAPQGDRVKLQREEQSWSLGQSQTHSLSQGTTHNQSHGLSQQRGLSQGRSHSQNHSQSRGTSQSRSQSHTHTQARAQSLSQSQGRSQSQTRQQGSTQSSSRSLTHGRNTSQSEGHSQSQQDSYGQSNARQEARSTQDRLTLRRGSGGLPTSLGHSHSQQESSSWSSGYSNGQSQSLSQGHSQSQGLSQSRSAQQSLSRTRGQNSNQTRSQSRSESHAHGESRMQASSQTTSQGESASHSQTRSWQAAQTQSHSQGTSESQSHARAQSSTRSTREVVEHFSLNEEILLNAHTLMSLPNREFVFVERGSGALQRTALRSLDMPMQAFTRLGSLDGLADLRAHTRAGLALAPSPLDLRARVMVLPTDPKAET